MFSFIVSSLAAFFAGVMIADTHRYKVVHYRLHASKKLKKNIKIVLLADMHAAEFGKDNCKLINEIDRQNPDIILMAGDMITAKSMLITEPALVLVRELSKKYPVYYGMGNHEMRLAEQSKDYKMSYSRLCDCLTDAGAHILDNHSEMLEEYGIKISGFTIPREFYRKIERPVMTVNDMEEHLGKSNDEAYQILIAHSPDDFDTYAEWGADLTVAGHVHGGLMKLPILGGVISPRYELFPKYDGGLFAKGKKRMVLSRGLGTHTLPIRIFNPGEICVIHLFDK